MASFVLFLPPLRVFARLARTTQILDTAVDLEHLEEHVEEHGRAAAGEAHAELLLQGARREVLRDAQDLGECTCRYPIVPKSASNTIKMPTKHPNTLLKTSGQYNDT